jgi:hypothetical protein
MFWEAYLRENCYRPSSPLLCLRTARPHLSHREKRLQEKINPKIGFASATAGQERGRIRHQIRFPRPVLGPRVAWQPLERQATNELRLLFVSSCDNCKLVDNKMICVLFVWHTVFLAFNFLVDLLVQVSCLQLATMVDLLGLFGNQSSFLFFWSTC